MNFHRKFLLLLIVGVIVFFVIGGIFLFKSKNFSSLDEQKREAIDAILGEIPEEGLQVFFEPYADTGSVPEVHIAEEQYTNDINSLVRVISQPQTAEPISNIEVVGEATSDAVDTSGFSQVEILDGL